MVRGQKSVPYVLVTIFVVIGLLIQSLVVVTRPVYSAAPVQPDRSEIPERPIAPAILRTRVALRQPLDRQRLEELGVVFLDEGEDWAQILVTRPQLETLARRGFQPTKTDALSQLLLANEGPKDRLRESVEKLAARGDALVEAARTEQDPDKRVELYQQAEELLVEDAAWIPLYHGGGYYLVKPHVKNLIITGQGTMNLAEVRIERP